MSTVRSAEVATHPLLFVSVTLTVPVPEAPQVTVTLLVPAPAVIEPPETVHE